LTNVELDVRAGEVHALCGQNGSGKSTLIKILSGFHKPDRGAEISFLGVSLTQSTHDAGRARAGMHFIHQELGLIDSLDASENLALASERPSLAPLRRATAHRAAHRRLLELGIDVDVRAPVGRLRRVERAMIAMARALGDSNQEDAVRLLVLDEPTVSLPRPEIERLFDSIRRVRDRGASVLYVSHNLEEVFEIADRISVLRDGQLVRTSRADELSHDALVQAMVGQALDAGALRHTVERTHPVLSVSGIAGGALRGLSFEVREGEILGVTGLVGSGMEDVPESVFGARPITEGEVAVAGRPVVPLRPVAALTAGMALVPTERLQKGCIPSSAIRENMTLPSLWSVRGRVGINRARERQEVAEWASRVELQRGSLERPIATLSGGNQQKVVIASRVRMRPKVLLLHEPTQGVDIGAKAAIYRLIGVG
jgi:ribose transport system ATP-binding protein